MCQVSSKRCPNISLYENLVAIGTPELIRTWASEHNGIRRLTFADTNCTIKLHSTVQWFNNLIMLTCEWMPNSDPIHVYKKHFSYIFEPFWPHLAINFGKSINESSKIIFFENFSQVCQMMHNFSLISKKLKNCKKITWKRGYQQKSEGSVQFSFFISFFG